MPEESQIQALMEMGFPREQAIDALEATGHDPNKAIAYLFGEIDDTKGQGTESAPIEIDPEPQPQQYDTVDVKVPADLPEFLSKFLDSPGFSQPSTSLGTSPAYEGPRNYFDQYSNRLTEFSELGRQAEPISSDDDLQESNRYRDVPMSDSSDLDSSSSGSIPNIKTEGHLVPQLVKRLPGYRLWVPLLAVLCEDRHFADVVMLVAKESTTPFVEELQKIVFFVQNFRKALQWYMLIDDFLRTTESHSMEDMYSDEEAVSAIYKELVEAIPKLADILNSRVESVDEEIVNDLHLLEVELDVRKQNLYLTLNEQFWGQGFQRLGVVKYRSVAPIVTIQLLEDDETGHNPFFLNELFYPEIYGDKALKEIQQQVLRVQQAEHERRALSRSMVDLNFFEGKRLGRLLRQATSVLRPSNEEAGADLEQLTDNIDRLRELHVEKQAQATKTIENFQLSHFEDVIKAVPLMDKFRLQGVIASDMWYYFRHRDVWVKMEGAELIDFDQVIADIVNCTRHGSQPITLVYVNAEDEPDWSDLDESDDSVEEAIAIESSSEEDGFIKLDGSDEKDNEKNVGEKKEPASDDMADEPLIDLGSSLVLGKEEHKEEEKISKGEE